MWLGRSRPKFTFGRIGPRKQIAGRGYDGIRGMSGVLGPAEQRPGDEDLTNTLQLMQPALVALLVGVGVGRLA